MSFYKFYQPKCNFNPNSKIPSPNSPNSKGIPAAKHQKLLKHARAVPGAGSHERIPRTTSFKRASPCSSVRMILQRIHEKEANRIQQMTTNKMHFYYLFIYSVNRL
ncbi:hypothetical protein V6Z12_A08G228700 [Gossypium hirsutum]